MANLAPTYSALEIIKSSLRMINGLESGEEPDAATAQDCLAILNQMIDLWNAEQLMIFTSEKQIYPFVNGQQIYTYGPGGDFDAVRPSRIDAAYIQLLSNPANPVELELHMFTDDEWQQVILKTLPMSLPSGVYDDKGNPRRTLTFWGVPFGAVSAILWVWTQLTSFATLTTRVGFPPAYYEAIRYNLAVRLAAENFGEDASAAVIGLALNALMSVKVSNCEPVVLKCDEAIVGQGGWVPISGGAWRP